MPQPTKVFSFAKGANGVLDISMYGVLRGDWKDGDEGVFLDAVSACLPTDTINVHINSEGGDMFAGIAIKNILESHPGEVNCIVEGLAASAASIIAMAGNTVMANGSMMMIHNPWAVVAGDADQLRKTADMLDKSGEQLVDIYKAKTGKSKTELRTLLDDETWLTADEAVEHGFADSTSDDYKVSVKAQSKRRVLVNDIAFPTNRVPVQIMAMLAQSQPQEIEMKSVFAALSLKDNANEAEALSAVTKISDERKQLLALTGKDTAAEAMGILAAWKSQAAELQSVKAEMEKQAAAQAARDFDAEIAAGKAAHKLAPSDSHERNQFALSFKGKPDAIATVSAYIKTLQPLVPSASVANAPAEPPVNSPAISVALSDEEKRVALKMGLSLEKVLANKQRIVQRAALMPSSRVESDEDAA